MDLAELYRNIAGKPDYPISFLDRRAGEVEKNFASYDYANKIFGFTPKIELEDGLAETWEWLSQRRYS